MKEPNRSVIGKRVRFFGANGEFAGTIIREERKGRTDSCAIVRWDHGLVTEMVWADIEFED